MDPSIVSCESHFSFSKKKEPVRPTLPVPYSGKGGQVNSKITSVDSDEVKIESITLDLPSLAEYNELTALKDKLADIEPDKYDKARKAVNPFEFDKGIFLNRASIKLANMLYVFELDGPRRSAAEPQFPDRESTFEYADIGAGPGGFTNVIQWRHANSNGYGMTIEIEDDTGNLNWNTDVIDTRNFQIVSGPNRGDLYVGWKTLLDMGRKGRKVRLVMADGGIETDVNPRYQEMLSTRLLASEAIVGVANTLDGGNFLLKIFDTTTKTMLDLIYLISQAFVETYIFKPCSSRPFNSERYLICKGRKPDVDHIVNILKDVLNAFTDKQYVSSILDELPDDFIQWLEVHNKISYEYQKKYINGIFYYIDKGVSPFPYSDHDKYFITWGIPSARYLPESQRRKRIRDIEYEETEARKKLIESRNKQSYKVVHPKGVSSYTDGVNGEEVFAIFLHFYNNKIAGVSDSKLKSKLYREIYDYCLNICLGMPQDKDKYPEELTTMTWSHTVEKGFYIFRYDNITIKYEENRIKRLLSFLAGLTEEDIKRNAKWVADQQKIKELFGLKTKDEEVESEDDNDLHMSQIYKLVARYAPFHIYVALGVDAKSQQPGMDAFETPLTYTFGRKYYSYYTEDMLFGSEGMFFNKYPIPGTWFILAPYTQFAHRRLESAIRESKSDTQISMVVNDVNTPLVRWIKESWKVNEYSVFFHDYSRDRTTSSKGSYINGIRLYIS